MRILFVVHQFFPQWYTGTERFVLNNIRQLRKMGYNIEVLTYGHLDNHPFFEQDGILVRNYYYDNFKITCIKSLNKKFSSDFDINDESSQTFFDNYLRNNKFDIIHIAHPMRLGGILYIAKSLKIPTIITLTDFWLLCPGVQGIRKNGTLCLNPDGGKNCSSYCYPTISYEKIANRYSKIKNYLEIADIVVSPSYFLANVFQEKFDIDIKVIYHGIDYSSITPTNRLYNCDKSLKIAYIGTILPHKGVHLIVQALKHFNDNLKIYIFGGIYDEIYIEKLLSDSKNEKRIFFMGGYEDSEITQIMNSVDMTICPSIWWENSPITILTSFAYQVPVIGNNIGGCQEFIKNGINGIHFNFNDPKDLASQLSFLSKNPEFVRTLKANVQFSKRVEEEAFDYEHVYQTCIHNVRGVVIVE